MSTSPFMSASAPNGWPDPPARYSFSSLSQIEACPRQWGLRNAQYPDVWDRRGYPARPSLAAIRGTVLHRALQTLVETARSADAEPERRLAAALRVVGGYSDLIAASIDSVTAGIEENPRGQEQISAWRHELNAELPSLRQRLQGMVSLLSKFTFDQAATSHAPGNGLPFGTYPEIWLESEALRVAGKVDLLVLDEAGAAILDYKSGESHAEHRGQVDVYAAVWAQDERRNPRGIPVRSLHLVYVDREEAWDGPNQAEIDRISLEIAGRVAVADEALKAQPPSARPSDANCQYCEVRQLCDAYWEVDSAAGTTNRRADAEIRIVERLSGCGWRIESIKIRPTGSSPTLLRTSDDRLAFRLGSVVRLIDAYLAEGEGAETYLAAAGWTECFELDLGTA